jgi:hypothetical protein
MSPQMRAVGEKISTYAVAADYCKIFDEQMGSLYLLAYLLTADADKAEQCFAGGLGECVEGSAVCAKELRFWARRAIVRHAIRMIRPAPDQGIGGYLVSGASTQSGMSNPFFVIVSLCPFERFVFVMSVLEGQADEDCQSLLKCSRQEVMMARKMALRLFAAADPGYERDEEAIHIWPRLLN